MKGIKGISVLISLAVLCCAYKVSEEASDHTNITIQVKGYTSGQVFLIGTYKNAKSAVDSTLIDSEGKFLFQRKEQLQQGSYSIILPDSSNFNIILNQDQEFSLRTNIFDLIGAMQVEGSLENDLYYNNLQFQRKQQIEWEAFDPQHQDPAIAQQKRNELGEARGKHLKYLFSKYPNTLFTKLTKVEETMWLLSQRLTEQQSEDQAHFIRTHFWDEVDFSDPRLLRTEVIFNHLYTFLNQVIILQTDSVQLAVDELMTKVKNHPTYFEFFADWILENYTPPHSPINDQEALYVHMVNTYLNKETAFWLDSMQIYARQLRAKDRALSLVGSQANNISGKDQQGKTVSLLDLKAPYVVLYFYNPECSHCIEETPHLVKFYEQNKQNGFEVFAIAMGAEDEVWNEFIEQNNMTWTLSLIHI